MGKGFLSKVFGKKEKPAPEPVWQDNPLYGTNLGYVSNQDLQPTTTETTTDTPLLDELLGQDRGPGLGESVGLGTMGSTQPMLEGVKQMPEGKSKMKDRHVVSKKVLGGGSVNEVTSMDYRRGIGTSGQTKGFFKKDPKKGKKAIGDAAAGARIGQDGKDTHMSTRAVLSSRLDKRLGTNVLTEEVYGKHKGKKGSVSSRAKGQQMSHSEFEEKTNNKKDWKPTVNQQSIFKQQEDGSWNKRSADVCLDIDLKNPETQRSMWNMQLLDSLTGQVDRHFGNMFFDKDSGRVTGIDNDLAFGLQTGQEERTGKQSNFLPELVDKETGEMVLSMTDEDFVETISAKKGDYGKLTEDELEAAKNRFRAVKDHVRNLKENGLLVDEWNDQTYQQAIDGHLKSNGNRSDGSSYVAEYQSLMNDSSQGLDYRKKVKPT